MPDMKNIAYFAMKATIGLKKTIMTIHIFETGYFHADGGAMFGAVPKTAWSRRYPADEHNGCILAMRSALVETGDGRRILIDTGAGRAQMEALSYYRFFQRSDLAGELRRRQIEPRQITDVVLTHLHFDHCGDCTRPLGADGDLAPLFPEADYWVSRTQWENFLHPHPLEKDSYFPQAMQAVARLGQLRWVEEDSPLGAEVELRLFGGHTPGQLVPYLHDTYRTVVFAGDVVPLAAHLSPEWISAYDTRPLESYNEKVRLLEEAAREGQTVIYCHDAYTTASTVKKIKDFYRPDRKITF